MARIASNIVEICVFKREKGNPLYLLLHRSKSEKIYPDIWQLVTGSIEGEEKAAEAALRELSEETAMQPKAFWVVPFVGTFYDAGWDSVNLCPMFAAEVESGKDPVLSEEHYEFGWYTYEEAIRKLVWPGQREGMTIVQQYIVSDEIAGKLTRLM